MFVRTLYMYTDYQVYAMPAGFGELLFILPNQVYPSVHFRRASLVVVKDNITVVGTRLIRSTQCLNTAKYIFFKM